MFETQSLLYGFFGLTNNSAHCLVCPVVPPVYTANNIVVNFSLLKSVHTLVPEAMGISTNVLTPVIIGGSNCPADAFRCFQLYFEIKRCVCQLEVFLNKTLHLWLAEPVAGPFRHPALRQQFVSRSYHQRTLVQFSELKLACWCLPSQSMASVRK
jgi:hypothetical protein